MEWEIEKKSKLAMIKMMTMVNNDRWWWWWWARWRKLSSTVDSMIGKWLFFTIFSNEHFTFIAFFFAFFCFFFRFSHRQQYRFFRKTIIQSRERLFSHSNQITPFYQFNQTSSPLCINRSFIFSARNIH